MTATKIIAEARARRLREMERSERVLRVIVLGLVGFAYVFLWLA